MLAWNRDVNTGTDIIQDHIIVFITARIILTYDSIIGNSATKKTASVSVI